MGSTLSKQTTEAAVAGPLTTFTLFPKLPLEVRRMIWRHSLPGERYFEFVQFVEPGDWIVSHPLCKEKKIPHMATCRDSRTEALREYMEFCGDSFRCPPIYVSPKVDIFCFTTHRNAGENLNCLQDTFGQTSIKRLATQVGLGFVGDEESVKSWLFALKLDELLLVNGEMDFDHDDPGIIGFMDGWTIQHGDFGYLTKVVEYCKEIEELNPGWRPPVIRMGSWVVASPSDFSHNGSWATEAKKRYGKAVLDGTAERREGDTEDWEEYLKDKYLKDEYIIDE